MQLQKLHFIFISSFLFILFSSLLPLLPNSLSAQTNTDFFEILSRQKNWTLVNYEKSFDGKNFNHQKFTSFKAVFSKDSTYHITRPDKSFSGKWKVDNKTGTLIAHEKSSPDPEIYQMSRKDDTLILVSVNAPDEIIRYTIAPDK